MTGELVGRVAVITGADHPVGRGLMTALQTAGATVEALPSDRVLAGWEAASAAVTAAVRRHGRLDALVHAVFPRADGELDFAKQQDEDIEMLWDRVLTGTVGALQAAHAAMAPRGAGRIVVVVPTTGMTGVPSDPLGAAASEGLRVLAKSVARQWGSDGITVNVLAIAPELVGAGGAGSTALAAPALGSRGDAAVDLGPLVVFLTGEASHHLTGATLSADGGEWMGA